MTDPAYAIRCPKCHSIPAQEDYTELPASPDSPMVEIRIDCHCGHSWTIRRMREEY